MQVTNAKLEIIDRSPNWLQATVKVSYDIVFTSSEGHAAISMNEFITLYGRDGSSFDDIGFNNLNPWYDNNTHWGGGNPPASSPWHREHYRTHWRTELNEDSWLDGLKDGWTSRDELKAYIHVIFRTPDLDGFTSATVKHEFGISSD